MAHVFLVYLGLYTEFVYSTELLLTGDAVITVADDDRFRNDAFNLTLENFLTDFYSVLGLAPIIINQHTKPCSLTNLIGKSGVISNIYLGTFYSNDYPLTLIPSKKSCINGKESHCIFVVYDEILSIYSIVAMGNDTLGSIFAAYSLTEEIFGVSPLHQFNGISGEYSMDGINISSHYNHTYYPPLFEYRATFFNDEDLIGLTFKDKHGSQVASLDVLDWIFESTLRMKANTILVGTDPYPDEYSLFYANKRGLYITDHHFNLLGTNTYQLNFFSSDIQKQYDWTKYPKTIQFMQQASIDKMNEYADTIWSVGYRGLGDRTGACPNCTSRQFGDVISQVIANQSEWLNSATTGGVSINKMTYMWDEAITLLQKGYLKIPKDVDIILTDSGGYHLNDIDLYANISHGIYAHTAMWNGWANQLSEMIPPWRIFSQTNKFMKKSKENKYAIINTSDMRPVILSTMACFCYLYHGTKCANNDPFQYIQNWVHFHYRYRDRDSITYNKEIAATYQMYYNISYIANDQSDSFIQYFMNSVINYYIQSMESNQTITNQTLIDIKAKMQSNATIAYIEDLWNNTQVLLHKIENNLTPTSKHFFYQNIVLQQAYHYYGQLIINNVYYSAQAMCSAQDVVSALHYVDTALNHFNQIFKYQHMSESNKWRGLFNNAMLTDFHSVRTNLRRIKMILNNVNTCFLPIRNNGFYSWYNYQNAYHDNFPYIHHNKSYHLSTYVRINCNNSGSQIDNNKGVVNCCVNNVNGGYFFVNDQCSNGGSIQMEVIDWNKCKCVRYTRNGTKPNQNSNKLLSNTETIYVTQTTNIQASCQYYDESMDPQVTNVTYTLLL
eukprot:170403_1